jgi:signal transduction histidine kinase
VLQQRAPDPVFLAYVAAFGLAALACFWSAHRLDNIDDADTRRGLHALLLTSGGWATASVAFLVLPDQVSKLAAYSIGLVLGFATIGAWLYFCSAYTGRTLHRDPTYRRLATGAFLAVVAVKLTNPIHGAYYSTTTVTTPFEHLAIHHDTLHWIAMALAYALAFVGYFMLVELFTEIDLDTRPIAALVAITGLPVALDVLGTATPLLVDIPYEPLGVAVFALGVAYAYTDTFEAVRFAAERDDPTIALDSDGRIRNANRAASRAFPALADAHGSPLDDRTPTIADTLEDPDGDRILTHTVGDGTRYYQVTETTYSAGHAPVARTVALTDVTERERYRHELERQNDRLETLAGMIAHDLRNPLNVALGQFDLVRTAIDTLDDDSPDADAAPAAAPAEIDAAVDAADAVDDALDRMQTLVDEILALARHGQPVQETEPISLHVAAAQCWTMIDAPDATIDVADDPTVHADPDRLKRLLENCFRNAIDHTSTDVTVTVGALPDGFYVADDGPGIPEHDRETVFDTGYTTDADGTGFGLAIVAEIADAHGWTVTATESTTDGARFEFTGVDRAGRDTNATPATTDPDSDGSKEPYAGDD